MTAPVVDMHVHVGLRGDKWPHLGRFSDHMLKSPTLAGLLLYGGMTHDDLTDERMKAATLKALAETQDVDQVVCLAMEPAYDEAGNRLADQAHMWVANEYVIELKKQLPEKILFGASVHPYDPNFKARVQTYVGQDAVLVKWLPSAMGIDLADERVAAALKFLATAKHGKPLPLLLHVGSEYSIPPVDRRMTSFNFLSWSTPDRVRNWFRGKHRFARPRVRRIRRNLREGLDAGAVIIFAHCGLPYWAPYGWLGKWLEHTDRTAVRRFLRNPAYRGKAFADVSAILTPFRHSYFSKLRKLPEGSLVMGSDFPVPIFTLPMDLAQDLKDLEEVLTGHMKDIVPKGNLIDVNYRELQTVFGKGHPMFTKFASLK